MKSNTDTICTQSVLYIAILLANEANENLFSKFRRSLKKSTDISFSLHEAMSIRAKPKEVCLVSEI